MQNFYLLLLMFCFYNTKAQTTLPDLFAGCGTAPNYEVYISLFVKIPEILGSNSAADYTITFHNSNEGAIANLNLLPTEFSVSGGGSFIVYARSTNISNSTFYIESFNVIAGVDPTINNAELFWCDTMETPIYNLNDALPQISNWYQSLIITFHETESDAWNGLSAIPNPTFYSPIVASNQILYVRAADFFTGCFSVSTLTLNSNIGQCSDQLILNAFLDTNANGVKDDGELNFIHGFYNYQVNSGNVTNANGTNGSHSIIVSNVTNSYNLNFQLSSQYSSYFSTSTSYNNVSIPVGGGITNYYFPVIALQPFSDVEVNIIANNPPPRPGFTYDNTIVYKNNGYQTIPSGTITFTKNAAATITNITQTGTTATANGFTFDYANLGPFETREIVVTMQVPVIPTVTLGDIFINSATITPIPDIIISNNASSVTQMVVGSYDPNDKMESRGPEIYIDTFTANDYLYYTIRFENTGTAAAEFIRIEDTLHADLNPATFEMIHSSHTYNVSRNGNALVWHFFDINLPPTIQNPVLSQGYVYFRIKPNPGFAIGDIIPNTAEIYFDYNPAIITNTFETEFVETLSTADFNFATISIYPNPTTSMLYFNSIETIKEIIVYDLLGNQVLVKNNSGSDLSLDVSDLSRGMYLIKFINAENSQITRKFIKN